MNDTTKVLNQEIATRFACYQGDSADVTTGLPDACLDYIIFSPPFSSLYCYSASDRDMGNSKGGGEFFTHYEFLIKELYRLLKPGRLMSFHCMDLPTSKSMHGYIGIRDFSGELIRSKEKAGFIYHSKATIWKCPVQSMQRTKSLGLLYKQLRKDASMSRQGIPDYLITMRKPGPDKSEYPVRHYEPGEEGAKENQVFPVDLWQDYASPIYGEEMPGDVWMPGMMVARELLGGFADVFPEPVWMDINPSDTLQYRSARENADEKHICPLQLEVIRRGIRLWTNPNDIVFSPFMGIGSELYVAIQEGRRGVGCELKASYYKQAVANCRAIAGNQQGEMFPMDAIQRPLSEFLTKKDNPVAEITT